MKKLLSIGIILGLLVSVISPAAISVAKPEKFVEFSSGGQITSISDGDVYSAGNSGRWRVMEREITGVLGGDINGDFVLTYHANIESVMTQSGNLQGTLLTDQYAIKVTGKISPLAFVAVTLPTPIGPMEFDLPLLSIEGNWVITDGAQGNGEFTAYAVFIPTEEGHVLQIINSGFSMTGKWAE